MKKHLLIIAAMLCCSVLTSYAQTFGNTPPLHVDGKHLKDVNGNIVRLHGVMDTPSCWFNSGRWGWMSYDDANAPSKCIEYFNHLFTAITDTKQGAYCNVFRLHLDPCWTNNGSVRASGFTQKDGKWYDPNGTEVSGEADIHQFDKARLTKFLKSVYVPIAQKALSHGLYVIMRPPGVCPHNIYVGDYYQEYLKTVWDIVSKNDTILKYSGQISIELANEPVNVYNADKSRSDNTLHDFFQPVVDVIRANGFDGIIWSSGTGYQSGYEGYAKYPITGPNIGYAVHVYSGWYGQSDNNANANSFISQFGKQVPVVKTAPIVVTEIDWSPSLPDLDQNGNVQYNPDGSIKTKNHGTWATASTSKWGKAWKAVHDHYGNIGMTLTSTDDYLDWNTYKNSGYKTVRPAFDANPECCAAACFEWYKDWNTDTRPYMDYSRKYTADQGNGTYVNPLINADFPDPDVIRVDDTYYMVSTTMFHFPGATILKSKDLVNWEYCANPLLKIADNDAYNLLNGAEHYSQGQWAASLNYSNGKFYLYFICYGRNGVDDTQNILLTTTNPEGTWEMKKMKDHYYDSGWLFDDGKGGDGYIYVACGINHIWVNKLDKNLNKISSERVIVRDDSGLEGCHMYHIGDYYYIYATYGGTEGSQTIFRSKNPMGPYEEHDGRVFANQHIHQGALVDTPSGEWWTILFKDNFPLGRIPYLEPVVWEDGWPIIGNKGIDVSKSGKAYKKPNVGANYSRTYLPTTDTFSTPVLGMQWQWNHNPVNSAWSLIENPGFLRLHTVTVTDTLSRARNSLTQRMFAYQKEGTLSTKMVNTYGTIKMVINHMQEGDVAGIAIFQEPYSLIGVKVINGEKRIYYQYQNKVRSEVDTEQKEIIGDVVTADTIYLRAVGNFGTKRANFYYSYDNVKYTKFGDTMVMNYTLGVFVGQRFYLFNYATKEIGGYVDIDWFSTEPVYAEEWYYGPGVLPTYSKEDLTVEKLTLGTKKYSMTLGSSRPISITCTTMTGLTSNVAANCSYTIDNPGVVQVMGEKLVGQMQGETMVTATYTDPFGKSMDVSFPVSVGYFPLTADGLNHSIVGSGKFIEKTGSLQTSKNGFAGWEYPRGVDLSDYKYIVINLTMPATCKPEFRIFDEDTYSDDCFVGEINKETHYVIDLHNLITADGRTIDPSQIKMAGFKTDGSRPIYIKEMFLSMDGETDATAIDPIMADTEAQTVRYEVFDLNGRSLGTSYRKGVNIVRQRLSDGSVITKKVLVK